MTDVAPADVLSAVLLLSGVALALIAGLGLVRFPDVFSRMHAATKPTTLGVLLVTVGAALQVDTGGDRVKLLLVAAFQFLTAPVAAHMIGRAAYFVNVPLWEGTILDELRPRYDQLTHELDSDDDPDNSATGGEADVESGIESAEAVPPQSDL